MDIIEKYKDKLDNDTLRLIKENISLSQINNYRDEFEKLIIDIIKVPYEYSGVYKGINYKILRHNSDLHLNGYIENNLNIEQNEYFDICEELFHGGITSGYENNGCGFDTAHSGDYHLMCFNRNPPIYKDLEYVKNIIFKTIDKISKLPEYYNKYGNFKNYCYSHYFKKN